MYHPHVISDEILMSSDMSIAIPFMTIGHVPDA
jgi:hypothetical protein